MDNNVENEALIKKKNFLIKNLFISKDISNEIYDEDDEMIILFVKAFDHIYISLRADYIDTPNRCWVNADGSVYVASGQDDPFLPILDGNIWYCGDESYNVGFWTEEDTKNSTRMPRKYNKETDKYENVFEHKGMMCIPEVRIFTLTEETKELIWEKYGDKIKTTEVF